MGIHARGHHEDHAGAPGDLGVHERHVHAVAERGIGVHRAGLLGRWHTLAGQGRLVDLEGRRVQDAGVCGDEVTSLQVDDVTGDQLIHGHIDEVAVPARLRLHDQLLGERIGGRRRLAFLVHAHQCVEQRQQQQEDSRRELVGQEDADHTGDDQEDLHGVLELAQEHLPARHLLGRGELVRAVLGQPGLDLGGGQAFVPVHPLLRECFVCAQGEPDGGIGIGRSACCPGGCGGGHDFSSAFFLAFFLAFFAAFSATSAS